MVKFKTYSQFNESEGISDIFRSSHAAIEHDSLVPLKDCVGKPKFPTEKQFQEAVDFLKVDPYYLFWDKKNLLYPFVYWKGPVYYGFPGNFSLEAMKMLRANEHISQMQKFFDKALEEKDYERFFTLMDKKILIPTFVQMYGSIPDAKKYDSFISIYVRSEYGFGMFSEDLLRDCFSKRKLSSEWKKRMKAFSRRKLGEDGKLTIYRGEGSSSAHQKDALSWTLDKKTAKFFAERFSSKGKIVERKIDPSAVLDYLQNRGESEVLVSPARMKIQENVIFESNKHFLDIDTGKETIRFDVSPNGPGVVITSWKNGSWWESEPQSLCIINSYGFHSKFKEIDIVQVILDFLSEMKNAKDSKNLTDDKHTVIKSLFDLPDFSAWWEKVKSKYSSLFTSRKYGV